MNINISRSLMNEHSLQVSNFMTCLSKILTSTEESMDDMPLSMEEADFKFITEVDVTEKYTCELEECEKALKNLIIENKPETIAVIQQLGGCCAKALDFMCLRILLIDHGIIKFSSGTSEFCQAMVYLGLYPRHENESPKKAAERLRTGLSHVPLPLRYRQWIIDLEKDKQSQSQKATAQDMPVKVKKKLALMRKGLRVIEHLLANMPREYPYLNFNRL